MSHNNLYTSLTLIRLFGSPLIFPFLCVYLLPINTFLVNSLLALIFALCAGLDFFDGYYARNLIKSTLLGRIIDPIADKFLLYSTLIALLTINKIYFYWVIILIGREFFVLGLRLIASEYGFTIAVSGQGKIKTIIQIFLMLFLIANPYQALGLADAPWWNGTEAFLLTATLLLAVRSAAHYYYTFIDILAHKNKS